MKKNEMSGACSAYWGEENRIQGFSGKPERSLLGRPRRRWEDNINPFVTTVLFFLIFRC